MRRGKAGAEVDKISGFIIPNKPVEYRCLQKKPLKNPANYRCSLNSEDAVTFLDSKPVCQGYSEREPEAQGLF